MEFRGGLEVWEPGLGRGLQALGIKPGPGAWLWGGERSLLSLKAQGQEKPGVWGRHSGRRVGLAGGWRSEVRAGVSPDSWDSGAPGHRKAHRSRPPCRRDPGKAGDGQDVKDPSCLHPPPCKLGLPRPPISSSFQNPFLLGPPWSSLPLSPHSLSIPLAS